MFRYKITFLGGSNIFLTAHDPKEAWNTAQTMFETMEVIQIKHVRSLW